MGREVAIQRACPECWHVFQGNGWDGIDAHWRAKHEDIMPYAEAWPLLRDGKYPVTLNTLTRMRNEMLGTTENIANYTTRQYLESLGRALTKRFNNVDNSFENVAKSFEKVNSRLDKVDSRLGGIEETLSRIEAKLDK